MSVRSGQQIVIPLPEEGKVRDRLTVSKQTKHRFHTERFNLKKLNVAEQKERYLLRSQTGSQFWKIWELVDAIKENINVAATESPYLYELKT
jgi:hypothetical protein